MPMLRSQTRMSALAPRRLRPQKALHLHLQLRCRLCALAAPWCVSNQATAASLTRKRKQQRLRVTRRSEAVTTQAQQPRTHAPSSHSLCLQEPATVLALELVLVPVLALELIALLRGL